MDRLGTPGVIRPDEATRAWFSEFCGVVPTDIEIGSRAATFLCALASSSPAGRFIGVEINADACAKAATRALRSNVKNIRIVQMEGYRFLSSVVPDESVLSIHIYFPTPFPESIGLKRRLVNLDFMDEARRILVPGGNLRIATDQQDYFAECCMAVNWPYGWQSSGIPSALACVRVF